jgi:gluconolactonase
LLHYNNLHVNKRLTLSLTSIIALMSIAFAVAQQEKDGSVVAKGAVPILVSSSFSFTEGPAADSEGNVYFTDQPNDKILKWSTDGKITVFLDSSGRANGLFFDANDNLIACADLHNQLWSITKNKEVEVLVVDFEGRKLNGPNDLWIDPKGGIYFTDPFYKRDYWSRTEKEISEENVYYLSPDKKKLTVAASGFTRPNGIVGTPDGKLLYVSDINERKTYSYAIKEDGTLHDKKIFADMGSDGMGLDAQGNVYMTGRGVTVFNSSGHKIETITIDAPWTANVCFGGKDRKTLFITASKSVFTLKMNVKGIY